MSERMLKFKKTFEQLQPVEVDCFINDLGIKLPVDYISFLRKSPGGYMQDDVGIRVGEYLHGGVIVLGVSSSNMTENIKFYNNMRTSDPLNKAERYFTIMIIDGGEICVDITTGQYFFFDATYCEFHFLCLSFDELLNLFEHIN